MANPYHDELGRFASGPGGESAKELGRMRDLARAMRDTSPTKKDRAAWETQVKRIDKIVSTKLSSMHAFAKDMSKAEGMSRGDKTAWKQEAAKISKVLNQIKISGR